jgi:N-methylhydantoinase B
MTWSYTKRQPPCIISGVPKSRIQAGQVGIRGGNGIEYALAVEGADVVSATLASHGAATPALPGVFGGYPGATSCYEIVRKSGWKERAQKGSEIRSLADLGGEFERLPIKIALEAREGDVINCIVNNGGGYGDPIERLSESVVADLRDGKITADVADRVYGVPTDQFGNSAADAVKARRDAIRRERLSRAHKHSTHVAGIARSTGSHAKGGGGRWAGLLDLKHSRDGLIACCQHCSEELGPVGDDWRANTLSLEVAAKDIGYTRDIDHRFEFEQNDCPKCAASLWLEARPRDGRTSRDFILL